MALMADPGFPFAAVGLVHLENEITQLRALGEAEPLSFAVHASEPEPHPRGRTFAILTTVHAGGELVWHERSTMLRRERAPERPGERGAGRPRKAPRRSRASRRPWSRASPGPSRATSGVATAPSPATATHPHARARRQGVRLPAARSPTACGRRPAAWPRSRRSYPMRSPWRSRFRRPVTIPRERELRVRSPRRGATLRAAQPDARATPPAGRGASAVRKKKGGKKMPADGQS